MAGKSKKTGKRGSGEGSVFQRKDGRWAAKITTGFDPLTGKQMVKTLYADSQKDAIKKREDYLVAVKTGTYTDPTKATLEDYTNRWLDLYVKPKVRESTFTKYKTYARANIFPVLGKVEIQKITSDMLQNFYNEKAKTHSSSTIAILHQLISGCLKHAVRQKVLPFNPAELTQRPAVKHKEVMPFDKAELDKFLETAKDDYLYSYFFTMLYTGVRRGELCALRWKDVNFKAGVIIVRESVNRIETYEGKTKLAFAGPKTENSKREIPLPAEVIQVLKAHKVKQNEQRLFYGDKYQDNDLVFARPTGQPMEPRNVLKRLKNILKRAGLREEVRVHTIRHTFGTMLGQAQEPAKNIQVLMGHADIRTTIGTYCHATLEDRRRTVDRLAALIGQGKARSGT